MAISFSQKTLFACPQCGTTYETEVWLIVDTSTRPDLLDHICNATLHNLTCSKCRQTVGQVDVPLLLYQPGKTPLLLFSPAEQTTDEQDQEQAANLVDILSERLGDIWKDAWVDDGLPSVPRSLLPAVLNGDSDTYYQIMREVEQSEQQLSHMWEIIQEFISAPNWAASYRQVKAHPELLSDDIDKLLEDASTFAQTQRDKDNVQILEEHRNLLDCCRKIGIEQAFSEKMKVAPETLSTLATLSEFPPEMREILLELANANIADFSSGDLERLQDEYPDMYKKLEAIMREAAADPEVPPEFRDDWIQIIESEQNYQVSRNLGVLETMIVSLKHILDHPALSEATETFQLRVLNSSGNAFLSRYQTTGSVDDLNQAIHLWNEAIHRIREDSSALPIILTNLGRGLRARYECTGQLEDLEQAIIVCQEALLQYAQQVETPNLPDLLNNLGCCFNVRYDRLGQSEDLENAINAFQAAVEHAPMDSSSLPAFLNNLSSSLHVRYEKLGHLEDLEQSILASQKAINCISIDSPTLLGPLSTLSSSLLTRYKRTKQLEDLEQAIVTSQKALEHMPINSPSMLAVFNNLSNSLYARYENTRKQGDLEQAITVLQKAVEHTSEDSPNLPTILRNLSKYLYARYENTRKQEDLEQAIAVLQKAVEHTSEDSPDLSTILFYQGRWLYIRYEKLGYLEDLEQSIVAYQKAVEHISIAAPELASCLSELGESLHTRYECWERLEDLEQVIESYKKILQRMPTDLPTRTSILNNLGQVLHVSYIYTGKREYLESMIEVLQEALKATLGDLPDSLVISSNLGIGFHDRYKHIGRLEDLEQAIVIVQGAVERTPVTSSELASRLSQFGTYLHTRYQHLGRLEDLEQAIVACKKALSDAPSRSSDLPQIHINLGSCLSTRSIRTGDLEDLEQAVEHMQRATELTPANSHEMPSYLAGLGNTLHVRYTHTGKQEDLERAIEVLKNALHHTPLDRMRKPLILCNLGVCFRDHYGQTGRIESLEQAIVAYQDSLKCVPISSSDLTGRIFCNLGDALIDRNKHMGQAEDLEQAIVAYQRAIELTPIHSPDFPRRLSGLGIGLNTRYNKTRQLKDLEQAIEAHKKAIEIFQRDMSLTLTNSPLLSTYLNNFGAGLLSYYERIGQLEDLDHGIEIFQRAVELTPLDSPYLPYRFNNLGESLRIRYEHTGQLEDQNKAVEAFEKACQQGLKVAPDVALTSARQWGNWMKERGDWIEAARAYAYGVQATEQLYRVQLLHTNQEAWLNQVGGLYTQAAYVMARANQLPEATLVLEQGRARSLSEVLARDQADLKRIQQLDPTLYNRYQQVVDRLRQFERIERERDLWMTQSQSLVAMVSSFEQLQGARKELEQVIALIQQMPDYEDFLAQQTYQNIAQIVQPTTPLAYLATTLEGSLALIVHASSDTPEVIWVNSFTTNDLNSLLVKSEGYPNDTIVGGYLAGQLFELDWLNEALAQALPKLGAEFVSSIASRLHKLGATGVTLIPIGLLGLLPIHTACYQKDNKAVYLLDEFNVAYIPSAQVLRATQRSAQLHQDQPSKVTPQFVGVANPLPDLSLGDWVQNELQQIVPILKQVISVHEQQQLRSQAVALLPNKYAQLQMLTSLRKAVLQRLELLCQEPAEQLLHAGRDLARAAILFANLPDLPNDISATMWHLPTRIPISLPYTRVELESVQALLPRDAVIVYHEHQATRDVLWNTLPQATIAHLACHGSFDPETPLDSALLLAGESRLTLRDLLNAGPQYLAHLHLVFLSACQTAIIDFRKVPDEVVGLLSGFLRVGVSSVVGTLWSVNDMSTALLVTRFYELLLHGDKQISLLPQPPVRALRLAQCWLRDLTYNNLFTYLKERSVSGHLSPKLAAEFLPSVRKAIRKGQGDECPYDNAYYWAGFVYHGVL